MAVVLSKVVVPLFSEIPNPNRNQKSFIRYIRSIRLQSSR
jgi:hypothetical protein